MELKAISVLLFLFFDIDFDFDFQIINWLCHFRDLVKSELHLVMKALWRISQVKSFFKASFFAFTLGLLAS